MLVTNLTLGWTDQSWQGSFHLTVTLSNVGMGIFDESRDLAYKTAADRSWPHLHGSEQDGLHEKVSVATNNGPHLQRRNSDDLRKRIDEVVHCALVNAILALARPYVQLLATSHPMSITITARRPFVQLTRLLVCNGHSFLWLPGLRSHDEIVASTMIRGVMSWRNGPLSISYTSTRSATDRQCMQREFIASGLCH